MEKKKRIPETEGYSRLGTRWKWGWATAESNWRDVGIPDKSLRGVSGMQNRLTSEKGTNRARILEKGKKEG